MRCSTKAACPDVIKLFARKDETVTLFLIFCFLFLFFHLSISCFLLINILFYSAYVSLSSTRVLSRLGYPRTFDVKIYILDNLLWLDKLYHFAVLSCGRAFFVLFWLGARDTATGMWQNIWKNCYRRVVLELWLLPTRCFSYSCCAERTISVSASRLEANVFVMGITVQIPWC